VSPRGQRQASRNAGVEARVSRRSTPVAPHLADPVLALQRSAGNAAVTDLVTRRGARGIHRAPLPDKDNEAIVARLHEAMAGWGTDEEAIFVSLQKLNKDAAAIAKVKELYKKTYSSELEGDIRDEMSGTELALACELLGVGGKAVGATPGNDAEILAVAKRLHSAMDQWGTDEEAIYAALIPFNRDPAKLEKLKKAYTDEFKGGLTGKGLEADIRDEMSSDELAYALYLMNAPPLRTAGASAVPNKPGTEDHAGKVAGGDVSVHTDVDYDPSEGGATRKGGFSVGYEGGLAADTGWVQFIWAEIVSTGADGTDTQLGLKGLPASNGTMDLTTDPDSPNYKVDSSTKDSPFYEDGGRNIRTATGTTLYDRPMEFSAEIKAQFDAGATKVVERDHFDQYLVQDYKTVYHTSVVVEWTYTSKTSSTKKSKGGGRGKITAMPSEPRKQLIAEYPKFDYIQ
jgi:Annexin